jgi:putative acetyltransferase
VNNSLIIREENSADFECIRHVNIDAFPTQAEADLVESLRISANPFISLVAERENHTIGHILFTPVTLENGKNLHLMGLGPMAVLNQFQNQGVGAELVTNGLIKCKQENVDAVVVLGHPNFYPKFGFTPSVHYKIKSEYNVPDDVFMIYECIPNILMGSTGIIKYHPTFGIV